jgi:hypothetical protein
LIVTLANILWAVVVILVVLWLLGLLGIFGPNLGGIVWILLIIAAVIVVYNVLVGRNTA